MQIDKQKNSIQKRASKRCLQTTMQALQDWDDIKRRIYPRLMNQQEFTAINQYGTTYLINSLVWHYFNFVYFEDGQWRHIDANRLPGVSYREQVMQAATRNLYSHYDFGFEDAKWCGEFAMIKGNPRSANSLPLRRLHRGHKSQGRDPP